MELNRLRALPKVELHNHLDGGLRVGTMLELAEQIGYELPADDPEGLAAWFYQGDSGSLVQYLAAFRHTVALMQTAPAIERIAYEGALDLVADGVIYGEIRYAPALTTDGDLSREDSIEAALSGFARANRETGVTVNLIVDAMRNLPDSVEDAKAAVRFAGAGVVGFDLAGPERGFPAEDHAAACRLAREGGIHITVHAGEAAGLQSIAGALDACRAERIGHGVHIVDDIGPDGAMGPIASRVLDDAIPLEVCPTSNLHTFGIEPQEHPLGRLYRAGFNVTLNTDNRLMSRVTLTDEFHLATEYHGMGMDDLHRISRASATAAFTDDATRRRLLGTIDQGYLR
jgi:adenosine deaminase